jgi:hypothetical protein
MQINRIGGKRAVRFEFNFSFFLCVLFLIAIRSKHPLKTPKTASKYFRSFNEVNIV